MPSFNKVILAGNLTRDPELRYTPSGVAIARISLAINRSWRSESGENREEVTYVEVDAFRRQAETLGQYLKKGSPLLVEGRLKLDQWEDKQSGQKRSRLGVVLDSFQFLDSAASRGMGGGGGGSSDYGGGGGAPQRTQVPPAPAADAADTLPDDDDVPF